MDKPEYDLARGCANSHSIYIEDRETGSPHKLIIGCGKRYDCMCPICAERWRKKNRRRFRNVIKDTESHDLRMLTLTLKKDYKTQPIVDRIKELWNYRKVLFRYLQRKGYNIRSWVACIELPNHMHIVMESDFIPQLLISKEWQKITGDSYYVWINQWKDVRDMKSFSINYITKYITKLAKIDYYTAQIIKGFHLVGSHIWKDRENEPKKQKTSSRYRKIDVWTFLAKVLDYFPDYVDHQWDKPLNPLDKYFKEIS